MSRWFRIDDDIINDPKILLLPEAMRWIWLAFLCIASKNDGALPKIEIVALSLRVNKNKAAAYLTRLVFAGLIDNVDGTFAPHNWTGRQYKTDKVDETAAERMARYRERKRNERNGTVTVTRTREQTTEKIDRIGSAGASNFTEGSKALASAFWKAIGFSDPIDVPPEFAGVDWRAVGWETAGWTVDLIEAEARRVGPGKPLTYHEKVFATTFAKRQAPLPSVEIRSAEKLTVTHGRNGKTGDIIAASDRLVTNIIDSFGAGSCAVDELRGPARPTDVRLLPQG